MASQNDITGDKLISKVNTEAFNRNFDAIFGKKEKPKCEGCFTCDCNKDQEKENVSTK